MSLTSWFSRAKEKDLPMQINEGCALNLAKIVDTINNKERGSHSFAITRQRVERSSDTSANIHLRGRAMLDAEEAVRCSGFYDELHDICKHASNNCHVEYKADYSHKDSAVTCYVIVDTSKPYTPPHLPVGVGAAPSTIFHNECTDDEVTEYDDDGIPIPPSLYKKDTVDDKPAEAAVEAAPEVLHITAPKVTFKRATV